jgi:hypothetical protein
MKRNASAYGLLAASFLTVLAPAAQAATTNVTGEVDVKGHVTGICAVLVNGQPGNSFQGTIDLGELAGPDGKLATGLTGSTIAGASQSFTVVCNSATPGVSLSATTMLGDAVNVLSGYTKTVNYTAKLDLGQADGTTKTFTYVTAGNPAATTGHLSAPLSANANNVTVSVNSLATNGSLLTAGNYGQAGGGTGGVISITITPV